MGLALLVWANNATSNVNLDSGPLQSGASSWFATSTYPETTFQAQIAGTLSNLAALTTNTGTGRTISVEKNNAVANETIALPDTTAGLFRDVAHSDSIVAGDNVALRNVRTVAGKFYWVRTNFRASAVNHACFYSIVSGLNFSTASTTFFERLSGSGTQATTEANSQHLVRSVGTLQNAHCYVATMRATNSTIKSRINGVDGTIAYTLTGGGGAGFYGDNSHSDPLALGDKVCWSLATGTGVDNLAFSQISGAIVNPSIAENDLASGPITSGVTRAASATMTFYYISGKLVGDTVEAHMQMQHGFPVRLRNARCYLSANTYGADAQATVRKDGVNANGAFTITGGAGAGWYEDGSGLDFCAENDDVCLAIVGGTSGSITIETMSVTEMDNTQSPPGVDIFMASSVFSHFRLGP